MSNRTPRFNITQAEILPAILMLIAAAGACMCILLGKPIASRIGDGVFNATYQFLLVAVLGSGVSVLFQTFSRIHETRERRQILQREIHLALVTGYNDAKRVRRILRARARKRCASDVVIDCAEYDRQLGDLSNAQLSIELATRRIELNRTIFCASEELIQSLKIVGKYLNSVVDEWEDLTKANPRSPIPIEDVPILDAFLKHWTDAPPFRDGFKKPFDVALQRLEESLATVG